MTTANRHADVDVIIPVRNRARYIAVCLDSVGAQSLQPNSVIVVDDGSSDGTAEVLDDYAGRWPKLRVIRSDPRGVSHARNLGLQASLAPFIAFLDSDDIWQPEKLRCQMSLFTGDSIQPGFVHCGHFKIDERGAPIPGSRAVMPQKRGAIFQEMAERFYHITGSASAVVARRTLVLQAGGFDESLLCGEDIDLWLRLARLSHVDFVPEALVGLRAHPAGTYRQAIRDNPELVLFQRLKIWNKWSDEIVDDSTVLGEFRGLAVYVGMANVLRGNPHFGLYGRLKRSDLALARRLFDNLGDYLQIARRTQVTYDRLKSVVSQRLILPNPALLGLCRILGRLEHVPQSAPHSDILNSRGRL